MYPVSCLSFHAPYRCRHSGECCTAGWPIPIETTRRTRLDAALRAGRLELPGGGGTPFVDDDDLPPGVAGILRVDASGACACYERDRRRCAIHRQLGHDLLPASCQHFPRVCLIDEGRIAVTLSHYCPSAAALLFREDLPLSIVGAPPEFAAMALEGLDARDALPPLLRPEMLADRDSYRRWERQLVALFQARATPEEALEQIVDLTEAVRRWEPRQGPLGEALDAAIEAIGTTDRKQGGPPTPRRTMLHAAGFALDRLVRTALPPGLESAAVPSDAADLYDAFVAPGWSAFAGPVRRYLAAHAFANWCAYQGRGLRTVVCSLVAALSVLRIEAARHCGAANRPLDAARLTEAFRSADLLLVHLASREELARRLSESETARVEDVREAV